VKNVKNNKPLRETLRHFEEHTSTQLEKLAPKENGTAKSSHYHKKSASAKINEIDSIRKLNDLARVS
jgi:hypothetical protein